MEEKNVYYEILKDTVFKRTITKNSKHKAQEKVCVGHMATSLPLNFGDVFLSQDEERYLQIIKSDSQNEILAYRLYEPKTSKKGFISERIYTSPAQFRSDLCSNRFDLY
jgi:hypothetical protein